MFANAHGKSGIVVRHKGSSRKGEDLESEEELSCKVCNVYGADTAIGMRDGIRSWNRKYVKAFENLIMIARCIKRERDIR